MEKRGLLPVKSPLNQGKYFLMFFKYRSIITLFFWKKYTQKTEKLDTKTKFLYSIPSFRGL